MPQAKTPLSDDVGRGEKPRVESEWLDKENRHIQSRGVGIENVVDVPRYDHRRNAQNRAIFTQGYAARLRLIGIGNCRVADLKAHQHVVVGNLNPVDVDKHFQRGE